jgi:DUF4097 and DUF4098 domain-containing protein YvlB
VRRETFQTAGPLRLDLRLPSGEIEVESIDGDEAIVELDATRDTDDVREVIENARIELRPRGEGHELLVDVQRKRFRFFDFGRGDMVLRVHAPHGTNVELSTASADVRGRGRFGELEADLASGDLEFADVAGRATVKSASGDVTIDAIGGDASVHTASGDVRIGRIGGNAVLRSASGDVSVDEAAASITVQTASGDQRVSSIESGRVTLQSASGDQLVGVRRGTRVRIDAKTMSGETSSELEPGDEAAAEGAAVELRATAMSGDIRIVRV